MNEASDFKIATRSWNILNDWSNYDVESEIIYNTEVLKFNVCDYNESYILIRGNIIIIRHQATQVAFKNCALFTKFITKIDETTTDDAEDLDLFMAMYNMIICEVYGFILMMKQLILMLILLIMIIL